MPYKGSAQEFELHPVGQHKGIVYMWKDRGVVSTSFGDKHKALIGIESISVKMDDGKPYVIVESLNIAFGNNSNLKARREQILGRELEKAEKYDFDPSEILNVRVGYVVKHRARDDGDGFWANLDGLWRLKDQTEGDRQSDIVHIESPNAGQNVRQQEEQGSVGAPDDPMGLGADTKYGELTPDRQYAFDLVDTFRDKGLISQEQAEKAIKKIHSSTEPDLKRHIETWESSLRVKGVDLPKRQDAHAQSSGDDDLPF